MQTIARQNPVVLVHNLFDSENVAHVGSVPTYEVQAVDGTTQPPAVFPFQTQPAKKELH